MKDSDQARHQGSAGTDIPPGRIGVEALFRAHAAFVAAFLVRLGAQHSEVEDLVQEVFLVAHRKGGYAQGPAQPRSWLGAIAVNVARNHHRRVAVRRHTAGDEALSTLESAEIAPDARYEQRESLDRVQRALDTLDLDHRATFVLYEMDGESGEAIASSFNIPVGTVYSRLHNARRRFSEAHAALVAAESEEVPDAADLRTV